MTNSHVAEPASRRPLRLWPGVAAAVLLCISILVYFLVPDYGWYATGAGAALGFVVVLWWLFFSRAPWLDRLSGVAAMVVAVVVMFPIVDRSISNGAMGAMLPAFSLPLMATALVIGVAATRHFSPWRRRAATAVAVVLGCGVMLLARTEGLSDTGSDLHWRWTATPEERLLALPEEVPTPVSAPTAIAPATEETAAAPATAASAPAEAASDAPPAPAPILAAWPGFRGPQRDGIVRGVRIESDWAASPPVEIWRKRIGPGWSSFAVRGNVIYTQEQRGDDELVTAYDLATGKLVWRHADKERFWESNAGPGPRGTPTISGGRVYALGATGVLNALDADTGTVIWSRNAAADTGTTIPDWGISSSPIVVNDAVIVGLAGQLAAYDVATGEKKWLGPEHGGSYSSPHLVTIGGVEQILQPSGFGLTSVAPDGTLLWEHEWRGGTIVQPAVAPGGDLLLSILGGTGGAGIRRFGVSRSEGGWTTEERWTSAGLKPYFNDFVIHKGHAYGFDGSILAAIDLADGTRKWKGGRYGSGQLVLLPDQDLLLVVSEEGELALVRATPDKFTEVAPRFKAIEGKTWNHPVVAGGVILVRNGEEMAAFRLPDTRPTVSAR